MSLHNSILEICTGKMVKAALIIPIAHDQATAPSSSAKKAPRSHSHRDEMQLIIEH